MVLAKQNGGNIQQKGKQLNVLQLIVVSVWIINPYRFRQHNKTISLAFKLRPNTHCGPRQLSRYSDSLRAGRSGYRIPVGGEIFRTCPDRPWGPPSLLHNAYRVFPALYERPGRDADPSPPSSAVGHERVELYLYSHYGPYGLYSASVPVQG